MLALLLLTLATGGTLTENVPASADPAQTYTLYLPRSYDAAKQYPLLLIFDPRGRGTTAAEIFREAAEEYGWILISSNGTRSDEGWEPNERALRALWPEVSRYSVDPRRVYATGFSGTTLAAWLLGIRKQGLAGVISVGGRFFDEAPPAEFSFAHYGFAGERDFNNREMRAIDALLDHEGKTHRFRSFDGGHQWITRELARDALEWMELVAMKEQRRPRDEELIEKSWSTTPRTTLRDARAALRTFEGLRPVDELRALVSRLEKDPKVQRELEAEAKWDAFEQQYIRETFERTGAIFARLRHHNGPLVPALKREYRIADLQRRSKRDGPEGAAARRLLAAVHGQMAFYLPRQLNERGETALAKAVLELARELEK